MSWGDLRNELLTLYARNAQRIRSNDRFLLRLILLLPVKVFRDSFRFDPPYSRWNRNQSAHSLRRFLIFANFANCQHTFREEQGELMVLFGPKTATFRENVFLMTINLVVLLCNIFLQMPRIRMVQRRLRFYPLEVVDKSPLSKKLSEKRRFEQYKM